MKIQELHKAVLTAICQALSDSADSVHMVRFTEDQNHIEGVLNFEHSSSYEKLEELNGILCRYGLRIGRLYFGEPAEIDIMSWTPDCRFKTAIAEACAIFDLYSSDDETIKDLDVEAVGRFIACAMKHKEL